MDSSVGVGVGVTPKKHPSVSRKRNMDSSVVGVTPNKHDKKKKKKVEVEANPNNAFKRVFSDSDEISILEHLIAFKNEKGFDPSSYMTSFYTSLQKAKVLSVDITRTQLSEKVRRFRQKFGRYSNHVPPDPSQTHQCKLFELFKKIWGVNGIITDDGSRGNEQSEILLTHRVMKSLKKVIRMDREYVDFESLYPYLASALEKEHGKEVMMQKWRSIEPEELGEMEDELEEVSRMKIKARRYGAKVYEKLSSLINDTM